MTQVIKTKRRLNNKFRFQLLQQWLTARYKPIKVLDVGGGKGLLSYLLNINGWKATVVDPAVTDYLTKYKDIETDKRVLLSDNEIESFPRIAGIFKEEMAKNFDLLIGLHAHGSNLQIINAAEKYNKDFLLLPCCVIDEPLVKKPNIDWLESLIEYAKGKGFDVKRDIVNFKGQNVLIYTDKHLARC